MTDYRSRAIELLRTAPLTGFEIALLAEALGTTSEYLLTGEEPRTVGPHAVCPGREPDGDNPCRCPCLGCRHNCAACHHRKDDR